MITIYVCIYMYVYVMYMYIYTYTYFLFIYQIGVQLAMRKGSTLFKTRVSIVCRIVCWIICRIVCRLCDDYDWLCVNIVWVLSGFLLCVCYYNMYFVYIRVCIYTRCALCVLIYFYICRYIHIHIYTYTYIY